MFNTEWESVQHPDVNPGGSRNGTRMAGWQVQEKSLHAGGTDHRNVCSSYTNGKTQSEPFYIKKLWYTVFPFFCVCTSFKYKFGLFHWYSNELNFSPNKHTNPFSIRLFWIRLSTVHIIIMTRLRVSSLTHCPSLFLTDNKSLPSAM